MNESDGGYLQNADQDNYCWKTFCKSSLCIRYGIVGGGSVNEILSRM
jgi:hypothetical protein